MSYRWQRLAAVLLSALVVFGSTLVASTTGRPAATAKAAGSWSGASAAGSGHAPWETFDQSVNIANGNLLIEGDGPSFPQMNGMDLVVAPVYNSLSKGVSTDLGHGWLTGTGRDVGLVIVAGSVTFYDETGHAWTFTSPSSCTFTPPSGIDAQLACSGNSYTLTENESGYQYQFDSGGNLTAEQNRVGNQITYTYDTSGRLTQINGPVSGQGQALTYNAQNVITRIVDPAGRAYTYGYNANGDLTSITDPASNVTQYAYDANDRLSQITDPRGNSSQIAYDTSGRVSTITDVDSVTNPTWTFSYLSSSSTQVADPNNHSVTYTFDGSNRVTSVQHPDNTTSSFTWTSDNHLATVVLPSTATTTYSYDGNNNLTQVSLPTGAHENWAYTDTNHPYLPTSYTDPQGNTTTYSYNANGTLSIVTDPTSHTFTLAYNTNGTAAGETDENSHITSFGYNALGLQSSTTYPSPRGAESYTYNSDNLLATLVDGKNQTTTYSYDPIGQPLSETSADGSSTTHRYDATGNEISMADNTSTSPQLISNGGFENGINPAPWTYSAGGTVSTSNPHSGTHDFQMVPSSTNTAVKVKQTVTLPSNATNVTLSYWVVPNGSGNPCAYFKGSVNLASTNAVLAQIPNPPCSVGTGTYVNATVDLTAALATCHGQAIILTLEGDYNATSPPVFNVDDVTLTSNTGNLTSYSYNRLDQISQKTLPNGNTISTTWDGVDNLLSKTDGGGKVTYGYSVNDELTSVTDPQNNQTTLGYDQDGNRTSVSYPNGVTETMTYDADGKLTKIAASAGTTPLNSFTYSYVNPANSQPTVQRYSMTDGAGNVTSYTYDSLNRLTGALQKDGSGSTLATYTYGYDPVGNMTSQNLNGAASTFTHNAADQVTGATGAISKTYTYDANGNRTGDSAGASLAYNPMDQTTSITPAGGTAQSMGYTGEGQSERTTAGSASFQYDETGTGTMTSGGSTTYFTNGPDGELISERLTGGTYYYLFDGLGSVVGLTDSAGNVVNSYSYDPYGNTTSVSETVSNPFRFTGAIWDSATGLYKMGERYYDPSTGRFTQPDPESSCGTGSTYTYAKDNPINFTDPTGERPYLPPNHPQKRNKHRPHRGKRHPGRKHRNGSKKPRNKPPIPVPTPPYEHGLGCFFGCLVEGGADPAVSLFTSCTECAITKSPFACGECAFNAGVSLATVVGCAWKCK